MGQCGCGSVWVCVRVGVGQCGCAVGQALPIVLSNLALYGGPENQLEMTKQKVGCGSVWGWVRVDVGQCVCVCRCGSSIAHRPVQPSSLRGSRQPAGNDQAKGRVWDGVGQCGSVWVWVSMGVCQSGCGCAVGQALPIVLSSLALYGGPDNQLEMTKQKVGCGSVWVWVRVGVGQTGCGSE